MFASSGKLVYSENPFKLIVEVDKEISRYYRSFIPKSIRFNKQKYDPHISVVRNENIDEKNWRKYSGCYAEFSYSNYIYCDETYWWLEVSSKFLEEVRAELGLPLISDITMSPSKTHRFHITICNMKNLDNSKGHEK